MAGCHVTWFDRISGLTGVAVAQWLAVRLQIVAAVLVTVIGLLAVLDKDGWLPRITTRSHG